MNGLGIYNMHNPFRSPVIHKPFLDENCTPLFNTAAKFYCRGAPTYFGASAIVAAPVLDLELIEKLCRMNKTLGLKV